MGVGWRALSDTRTRDLAVKLRGAAYADRAVLRGRIRAEASTIDWLDEVTAAL